MAVVIHHGEHEGLKAAVHGIGCAFAAVCLGYNVCAWLVRREPHLARNFVFYGSLTLFERVKVKRHLESLASVRVARRMQSRRAQ